MDQGLYRRITDFLRGAFFLRATLPWAALQQFGCYFRPENFRHHLGGWLCMGEIFHRQFADLACLIRQVNGAFEWRFLGL